MALTRTLAQMREATYRFANVQGTTARLRHPETDVNDAINRALGSLYRKLTEASADQRFLSTTTITTADATTAYALPSDFEHLICADITANGVRRWLHAYEPSERPALLDTSVASSGIPFSYRLMGSNIELLPEPTDEYSVKLWYVPTVTQFTADAQTFDTVNRLDDYVIAYAARTIATKDKAWDLVAECRNVCNELSEEIAVIGRNRDKNSPPTITDVYDFNRFGRRFTRRRW